MSKLVTFTNLLPPTNLSGSIINGGTLVTGSTFFYVIQACFDSGITPTTSNGRSQSSNQISASITTSGSQSVQLFWTASDGAGGYRIYRATSSGSYTEVLNSVARTSVNCSSGTCSFIDNGISFLGNSRYQNTVRGKLDLSGSTLSNPYSIVDLFNSSSNSNWNIVDRLDSDTYAINTYVNGHNNMVWSDLDKVILFKDGFNPFQSSTCSFGEKLVSGVTRRGCRVVFKTPDFQQCSFGALFAYKTTFDYVTPNPLVLYENISPQNITYNSGSVEFCTISKIRGFQPQSKENCSMTDTSITEADIALGQGLARFSKVTAMGNSRVFQTTNNTQITASNINFFANILGATYLIGTNFNVKYINSGRVAAVDAIQSAATRGITQDVFTYDLKVLDTNGMPISGASVELVDVSGSSLFSTSTNSTGSISQQEVLLFRRIVSNSIGITENLSPYTLTVFKNGYNEYREVTQYSSSLELSKTISLNDTGSIITINLL